MVQALERRGLLPAIDFIFSRAGCDAAVQQCLDAGLDLTTPAEKAEITAAVEAAAAVIVMSDTKAAELGLTPLARIVSTAVTGLSPEIMGYGPVAASELALKRAGMTIGDIDLVEINEAFAAQVIPSYRDLNIDIDKLNVHGGAIAVGHPFGMTGARITGTLINGLQTRDKTFGLETMCVGGGQGMAMVIERLS
jgi:acetyl-CoA C-acetyltransferase